MQAQDVAAHLAGRRSLAVQPRLEEGDALLGAIDIDATRPEAALGARAFAEVLALVARHLGWTVLLEDTGGRGFHLWFPLQRPVAAHALHRALAQLITRAAEPAEGVSFEILPGRDDAPETHAQTLVLPLGVHRSTGRRSALLAPTVLGPELEGLFELLPGELPASVGAAAVMPEAALQRGLGVDAPLPSWASFGAPVARLMEGCALLRHLAEKAVDLGHLNHAERLSLLYSLGHLGPQGERALHAIISRCANYDVIETNRQIQRLTGLPIGCSRLREKHLTPALEPACRCDFGEAGRRGGYPTPLLHTSGFRRAWREALRERAERRRGDPNAPPPTAPVTRDEPPAAAAIPVDGLEVPEEPLRLATPPHTWA